MNFENCVISKYSFCVAFNNREMSASESNLFCIPDRPGIENSPDFEIKLVSALYGYNIKSK